MKYLLSTVSSAFVASQLLVYRALALEAPDIDDSILPGDTDLKQTIIDVLGTILDFVLLLAVVFVVVAGIRLIVSGGDEGQKDTAKKTIIYVIVGIVVILLARVIVSFVSTLV